MPRTEFLFCLFVLFCCGFFETGSGRELADAGKKRKEERRAACQAVEDHYTVSI